MRGTLTADLDGEPHEVSAGEALFIPINDAPPPPQRGRRRRVHRLPPRAPGAAARHRPRGHRVAMPREADAPSPASASSPWRRHAGRVLGDASRPGVRRRGKITFFDPAGFRSQIAAEVDFDPLAAGLERARGSPDGPLHPVRGRRGHGGDRRRARSTSRTSTAIGWGSAWARAVGGTMALEDGYVAVSDRGQEWLVDPDYAPPFLYQGLDPQQPGERDRPQVRRARSGGRRSRPAARPGSTRSATATS